ncbi:MAG TPA: hypothetical protein VLT88_08475, partial [Desulfosarcina sp.]|nr:hypothetical protein [Desulfosarcina sp.]
MTLRRMLIIAPASVTLVLLISYFWVPTYEEQTRGNPDRLVQFVTTSSGDAAMLNPILAADSASSQINGLVFEGLIDRDENLQFRGRVAHSWKIYEQAFFYINPQAATDRWGTVEPAQLAANLRAVLDPGTPEWGHVAGVDLLFPEPFTHAYAADNGATAGPAMLRIAPPPRIRIVLDRVDQTLFERLAAI